MNDQDELVARQLPAPSPATEGLIVLGMHRSGTSAATRLVNLLGPAVCEDDDLLLDPRGNEKGHWESISLVAFNDRLLAQMERNWWCPPRSGHAYDLDAGRVTIPPAEGREAFDRTHRRTPWVWKDPRTCATLPYWRRALGGPLATLVVFRNPVEVGLSLLRRSKIAVLAGVAMWERYNRLILEHARGLPTYVARYEDLVDDPDTWCERIGSFLCQYGVLDESHVDAAAVEDFVESGLRHSRLGREDVIGDFAGVLPVLDVLEDLVGSWPSFDPPPLAPEPGWVEAELVELGCWERRPVPSPVPMTVSCVFDALGAAAHDVAGALALPSPPYEERIVVTDRPEVVAELLPPPRTSLVTVPPGTSRDAARSAGVRHASGAILEFRTVGALAVGRWTSATRRAFAAGYGAVSPAPGPSEGDDELRLLEHPTDQLFAVDRLHLPAAGTGAADLRIDAVAGAVRSSGTGWAEAAGVFVVGPAAVGAREKQ